MSRRMFRAGLAVLVAGSGLGCTFGNPASSDVGSSGGAVVVGPSLRRPQGLYVHVELDKLITGPGSWSSYLECYFGGLLLNPAVSGIELSVGWNEISLGPSASQNDWTYVDDAFAQVKAWNDAHPMKTPKTIQLIVTPGFKSPTWLLDELTSCDTLFSDSLPQLECGEVTITGYTEGNNSATIWPLPWDPSYKAAWMTFLGQLSARYGSRPELVSLSMGGPTGTSNEMFVPHFNTGDPSHHFGGQQVFGSRTIAINDVMAALIANWANFAPYKVTAGTDGVFVTEWGFTVAGYASIFQNLTLLLTPAEGGCFPDLSASFTVPAGAAPLYDALCQKSIGDDGGARDGGAFGMSCATTAEIMENFREAKLGNGNGKGSQMSGLGTPIARNGQDTGSDFGIKGVRWLAEYTESADVHDQIIGGAQFTRAFSGEHGPECTAAEEDTCSVEQAQFNVLATAFDETTAACFFGFTPSTEPLNFLQIFAKDYEYATAHADGAVMIETENGRKMKVTVQELFNQAYLMIGQVSLPQVTPALADAGCGPSPETGALPPSPPVCVPPVVGCDPPCTLPQICNLTSLQCETPTCKDPPCQT